MCPHNTLASDHSPGGLSPSQYPSDRLMSAGNDAPRESIPTGGRDFGLVWSFGAGVSGIYRTQQTQLTTSNRLPSSTASSALSLDSFSDPPFTFAEGGTKSWMSFGSAASLLCTAPAGAWLAGPAVRNEGALDSFHARVCFGSLETCWPVTT